MEFGKKPVESLGRNDEQLQRVNIGSVDIEGTPVLRTKTGGWKASLFMIVFEFSERLAYFAIQANLIIYLTTVLNEGLTTSVKNVNYWTGVAAVMPLVGGFIADVYCGRYWMIVIASIIYVLGLGLLTISVSLPALKPPDHCQTAICKKATTTQIGVFFFALYLLSLGTSGHQPALQAFGADQFDEEDKDEMLKMNSFFNLWYLSICIGNLLAVTIIAYIQQNISWGLGFGIVTVAMGIASLLFLYGTPFYRYKLPGASPITRIAQVIVAAIRKRNISMPSDMNLLYENEDGDSIIAGQRLLSHTDNFQFLDKAAVLVQDPTNPSGGWNSDTQGGQKPNPWKICTVTQVEETKLIFRMVPIWFFCLIFGVAATQSQSFFIKQASTMDRSMGSHFQVPSSSLLAVATVSGVVFIIIYDRGIVPLARRITLNERGITILQRIGIGMFLAVMCMVAAALTEEKRIHVAKIHGLLDSPGTTIPLSVFWLTPQFVLMGIADVFLVVGLQEYFYDQVPDNMRSLGIGFFLSDIGVASFVGSLVITIIEKITKRGGHPGWFVNNLNRCKLNYFYWFLAILSGINLCCYICAARKYTYKKIKQTSAISGSSRHYLLKD